MAVGINPISTLVNNVADSVEGFVGDLLGNATDSKVPIHPRTKNIAEYLSQLDQSNWLKLSFPYTFSVMNIAARGEAPPFTDFSLPIAPSSIRQSEEFAISIRPTQGGTTTSHSGNRYKSLTIKGTTGNHPFKGAGGASRKSGEAIFQPKDLKHRSGYEVFIRLRNWFKAYYEFKFRSGTSSENFRLVFKNYKDGEFLIVELLRFDMDRQSSRSFLYDYELEFKVLAHVNFKEVNNENPFDNALNFALDAIDTARGVFLRSQDILRQVESTYAAVVIEPLRRTSLAIKALLGVGSVAADMGNKIIKNTVSASAALAILLGLQSQQKDNRVTGTLDSRLAAADLPNDLEAAVQSRGATAITDLDEALMAMDPGVFPEASKTDLADDRASAVQLTRSFFETSLAELIRVKQNMEDFLNLGDPVYDALFNRTTTLQAQVNKVVTQEELELLNGLNSAITGLRLLLSTDDLFKSTYDERIQDMVDRFDGNIELLALGAARQAEYVAGTTLERIAQKELGDSSRWGEIVELNGLKAPYITADFSDTRDNLLKPGSKFLIPTSPVNGFSQVPAAKEIKTTRDLNELERSLGTDLKLTSDFDLSISNTGDLEVVSGAQNMAQAVMLKLGYEKGEVIRYPELGAGIVPGTKFPPLEAIRNGITNTLLADNRIDNIEQLELQRDNSALYLTFTLKIKQIDLPIPIKIRVA